MDITETIRNDFLGELLILMKDCQKEVERLTIENGLFRAASEEQRILNGQLRMELQALKDEVVYGRTNNI